MKQELVVQFLRQPQQTACALCNRESTYSSGPQLALADGLVLVCGECGNRHAPGLATLLGLARTAERVGTIARNNRYWLPLKAQLDLVHAAENFALVQDQELRRQHVALMNRCNAVQPECARSAARR